MCRIGLARQTWRENAARHWYEKKKKPTLQYFTFKNFKPLKCQTSKTIGVPKCLKVCLLEMAYPILKLIPGKEKLCDKNAEEGRSYWDAFHKTHALPAKTMVCLQSCFCMWSPQKHVPTSLCSSPPPLPLPDEYVPIWHWSSSRRSVCLV